MTTADLDALWSEVAAALGCLFVSFVDVAAAEPEQLLLFSV